MHSGKRSLVLEDGIDYDSFPTAADTWANRLGLRVTEKLDGPAERLWSCEKEGHQFYLAYDDWFPEISLEPRDDGAALEVQRIGAALVAHEPKTQP